MPEQSGYLTLHVLDTARGQPAAGMPVTLYRVEGDVRHALAAVQTNADGRCDGPLLAAALHEGTYELVFDVAAWRAARGDAEAGFYDLVPIRFVVSDAAAHYHVPLLISPFGYSTYRGS